MYAHEWMDNFVSWLVVSEVRDIRNFEMEKQVEK